MNCPTAGRDTKSTGIFTFQTLANKLAADEITTVPAIVCMHIAYQ